jgi:hypothetical protein
MKARFQTQCSRCREWITVGATVEHAYGGYWHKACYLTYIRSRHALAASGKIER